MQIIMVSFLQGKKKLDKSLSLPFILNIFIESYFSPLIHSSIHHHPAIFNPVHQKCFTKATTDLKLLQSSGDHFQFLPLLTYPKYIRQGAATFLKHNSHLALMRSLLPILCLPFLIILVPFLNPFFSIYPLNSINLPGSTLTFYELQN